MRRIQIQTNPVAKLLDRVIETVAPIRAARRLRARAMMAVAGGYLGGRSDRGPTKTWKPALNSADADVLPDLAVLRERSRDLVRNAPLAAGALGTVVQNAVGTGLVLQPRPDAELLGMSEQQASEWISLVQREFRLWSETPECDITRTQDFYGLQDLTLRSMLESGDVFCNLPMLDPTPANPYSLRVQLIEGDRVSNPKGQRDTDKMAGGVEVDERTGAPVAYHILDKHPGSLDRAGVQETQRILAFGTETGRRTMLHIFVRVRPGQHRGAPWFAPVTESLKQLDRYTEAEVHKAITHSFLTVFIETPLGEGIGTTVGEDGQAERATDTEIKLGSGNVLDLKPGEKVTPVSSGSPSTGFDPFVQAVLQQVGGALGIPLEVLTKRFQSSYSAARAALLDAWKFFKGRREFLAGAFCAPVYEAWMWEAVSSGRVQAPGFFDNPALRQAYLQAEWIGDSQGAIDPVKEVQAAQMRLAAHLSTREDECLQLTGKPFDDQVRQLSKEKKQLEEAGLSSVVVNPGSNVPALPAEDPAENPAQNDDGSDREDIQPAPAGQPATSRALPVARSRQIVQLELHQPPIHVTIPPVVVPAPQVTVMPAPVVIQQPEVRKSKRSVTLVKSPGGETLGAVIEDAPAAPGNGRHA